MVGSHQQARSSQITPSLCARRRIGSTSSMDAHRSLRSANVPIAAHEHRPGGRQEVVAGE